jgi:hypothetical protein
MKLKHYIIKRIKTEVEIGHKINHPNIVRFVYFSETTRNIYIFMELCDVYRNSYTAIWKSISRPGAHRMKETRCPFSEILSMQPVSSMITTSPIETSRLRTFSLEEPLLNWLILDSPSNSEKKICRKMGQE